MLSALVLTIKVPKINKLQALSCQLTALSAVQQGVTFESGYQDCTSILCSSTIIVLKAHNVSDTAMPTAV